MKLKNLKATRVFLSAMCVLLIQIAACKKKTAEENELITTVKVHLKKGGTDAGSFVWRDPDGDGGNPPQAADTIRIDTGQTYTCTIEFLNESVNPAQDITEEIKSEAANHRICFTSGSSDIVFRITDTDGKFPVGLNSEWKAAVAGIFNVRIVLRHQPGTKDGTCDPGDTDADVTFPVLIK